MKFGDVVIAVASIAVIAVLIGFPLMLVLIAALGFYLGQNVGAAVSFLLSSLIVGYIFAGKILEARREAIAKITVLAAVLVTFNVMFFPTHADWAPYIKETYEAANPGSTLSTLDWFIVELMALSQVMFLNVVIVLVLGFIGLYVGSMLRRPVKSGK